MIKLVLSAPVPVMAEAFKRIFADAEGVTVVCAPFETIPEFDCMVSAANSFGLMDGGVDAAITAYFGTQLQTRIQQHILREYLGEQPVGTAFVIDSGDGRHPFLVHAPTMRVPKIISGTDTVYQGTWAALLAIHHHNLSASKSEQIRTAVFPAMGAGCGQVPPDSVARQMRLAWLNFSSKPPTINWSHASNREVQVFNTSAYCPPDGHCLNASKHYFGQGESKTTCLLTGGTCTSPQHQAIGTEPGSYNYGVKK
ncbi:macro domain-containing protein [Enterobacter ludwigii]|uniref:macro domain-containing protein n=1 Tax=Enterobacter ludwigii TaxID=299767 RepID=UPI0009BB1A86|nr:macro domain-containing protein [Enterobacter ludwigii]